jgi:hypothetical protein
VEVTSEDPNLPIEEALVPHGSSGWKAAGSGEQIIRLVFDSPQKLRQIRLSFREDARPRTQEFVLRWSADGQAPFREILRQQFNFSPPATTQENEDYRVEIEGAKALELAIVPDINGAGAVATLSKLQLA